MRLTEYFHWITREDLPLGRNPHLTDYTHFTPWTRQKRERYLYQCMLRNIEPVK